MNEDSIDILIDLLKIYKKYGVDKVVKFRDLLKTKDIIPEMSDILDEMRKLSPEISDLYSRKSTSDFMQSKLNWPTHTPNETVKNRSFSIQKELDKIKESFPKKYEVLKDIHSKLLSGELLPTLAKIRSFAVQNHIPGDIGKNRRSAIRHLMLFLITPKISMNDIDKLINEMVKFTSNSDNSTLQRWADMIMRDKDKENDNHSKGDN